MEARGPGIPRTSIAPAALTLKGIPAVPGGKEEALEDLYLQEHRCREAFFGFSRTGGLCFVAVISPVHFIISTEVVIGV
jgi:hypothetical protein